MSNSDWSSRAMPPKVPAPLPDDYWAEPPAEPHDPEAIAAGEAAAMRVAARDILVPAEPGPTNLQPIPVNAGHGKLLRHHGPRVQHRAPSREPKAGADGPARLEASGLLPAEVLVQLVADHRARLVALDLAARGLVLGAWTVGAVGLTLLLAALVSLFAGAANAPMVTSVAAVLSGVVALGLAGTMAAGAVGLRHIASTSAQLSAVVEALSQPR